MKPPIKQRLIQHLSQFVTPHKLALIDEVLQKRTRFLTIVLEDLYQTHNANAVLRSCECFGVQDVHVIEQKNKFQNNPAVTLGTSKWLTLKRHENTKTCLQQLKKRGYQIAAMTLQENSIPLQQLTLNKKIALCFGSEEPGLSAQIHQAADVFVKIPMHGFTQSFNISVSAAITLFHLTGKIKPDWHLTDDEKLEIKIDWLTQIVPRGETLKQVFLKETIL